MMRRAMKKKTKTAACLAALVLLIGCTFPGMSATTKTSAYKVEQLDPRIVEAQQQFSFALYRQILKQKQGGNVFVSPLSIATALTMAYNGAGGSTKAAMGKALQLTGLTSEEVNKGNEILLDLLTHSSGGSQLSIANSIWVQEGAKINQTFIQQAGKHYGSEIHTLNLADAKSAATINQWVQKHTGGKIPAMVEPPLHPQSMLLLMNAVYFKGNWNRPFEPSATRNGDFHLADGNLSTVPMMYQSGSYEYMQAEQYQVLRLPYADKRQGMLLILPGEGIALDTVQESILSQPDGWMKPFPVKSGTIQLPRFTMKEQLKLNEVLKALGMSEAFDPSQADFSGIAENRDHLAIEGVLHKAFVDVNEKGTEAAAATSMQMAGSAAPVSPFQMQIDRPFFFAIEDRTTGALLFMGSVYDPTL